MMRICSLGCDRVWWVSFWSSICLGSIDGYRIPVVGVVQGVLLPAGMALLFLCEHEERLEIVLGSMEVDSRLFSKREHKTVVLL